MANTLTIDFHGDRLLGIETERGAFVYLKPIVEQMGLDWSAQLRRVKRHPILKEGMAVMATPPEFGSDSAAMFLRIDLMHGWLFALNSARVKAVLRAKLLLYQREAYRVLFEAFRPAGKPDARPLPAPEPGELLTMPERRKLVAEARQTHGILFARQLWRDLRLPIVAVPDVGQMPLFTYEAQPIGGR